MLDSAYGALARLTAWSRLGRTARYAAAVALVLIALGVRFLIAPQDRGIPYVTFFPAATLAAIFGGIWAGLFAAVFGAALAVYFFLPPLNAFSANPEVVLSALVFCLDEVIVCSAIEGMRRYYQRFVAMAEALRESGAAEARARLEAELANAAKSKFLAAASHDLRQPYQALRLYHAAMSAKLDDPAALGDLLRRMEMTMDAGETLLRSLLDLSTLEAGIVEPKPEAVSIPEMIAGIAMRHRPVAEAKGLRFHVKACDGALRIDPVLIGRVLDNLLSNAIRYTVHGSVRLEFRFWAGRPAFLVRDTGIGIAPEHQEAVFDEFFQVAGPSRGQGVGLGLAVARKTAAVMGAELKMRSRRGKGTLFVVAMPLQGGSVCSQRAAKSAATTACEGAGALSAATSAP